MKAMAMGAIPITSKYTLSVLPTLTKGYDLGPTDPLTPHHTHTDGSIKGGINSSINGSINDVNTPLLSESSAVPFLSETLVEWEEKWVKSVVRAYEQEQQGQLAILRNRMKKQVREMYTWERTADVLVGIIEQQAASLT
jgi:hypothetical protein